METNNFDIIRFWAVLSVMLGHFALFGFNGNEYYYARSILTEIAYFLRGVVVLFTMSGFLVADSFERTGCMRQFIRKRFVRIYPGLWACTIVNIVILFFLVGQFFDESIIFWLITQVPGIANTPDCLRTFATGSVNGALWSIFVEVQLYILLGLVYGKLKKLSNMHLLVSGLILLLVNLICGCMNLGGITGKLLERLFLPYTIWFYIGVVCYLKKEAFVPLLTRYLPLLIAIYVGQKVLPFNIPGYYVSASESVLLPLIVIGAAYLPLGLRFKMDLTYGMYLYHWIILNILIYIDIWRYTNWYIYLIIFIVASMALAFLSWKFIEKPWKRMLLREK